MNYKDLRKEFKSYQKHVETLLSEYKDRYKTKTNRTIYQLMVMALQAELQNILYNLKFGKLETGIDQVKQITSKYLTLASEGNQNIVGTLRKFIGELEYLFISEVKVEYEYYIKKDQALQEQQAIRQQMREEAEEKKRLEEQKKQIAIEESKYQFEIEKLEESLGSEPANSTRITDLEARIAELKQQLEKVESIKEEIVRLQNGKAGNVYIISNLGSFGDQVFKIGMTRRLEPQERVNELGSASVPFKFDVHSFIFSNDAVSLENELHKRLNAKRLNKVNRRKEFFKVPIEELEELVLDINPSAEFNRTMLAEDYKQSLSIHNEDFSQEDYMEDFSDEDEEELLIG